MHIMIYLVNVPVIVTALVYTGVHVHTVHTVHVLEFHAFIL